MPLTGASREGGATWRALWWVAAGSCLGALLAARGALRHSLLLVAGVGTVATAFGLALAPLDARSRLPTRRLLAPLSVVLRAGCSRAG